jgi:hypothetical protein
MAASSELMLPKANARRVASVSLPDCSANVSDRDNDVHARGVENGVGTRGTGRIKALGMYTMYERMSGLTPAFFAHTSHCFVSTRK